MHWATVKVVHVKHCRAVENGRKVEEALLNTLLKLTEFPIGQTRVLLQKKTHPKNKKQNKNKNVCFFQMNKIVEKWFNQKVDC